MRNKLLITLSLCICSPVFSQTNSKDNFDQVSQELESFMNEGFDEVGTNRAGKVDKDYDVICDQTPIKPTPKWQQFLNNIGGTILLRAVLFKRFIAKQCSVVKNSVCGWFSSSENNKSKKVVSL